MLPYILRCSVLILALSPTLSAQVTALRVHVRTKSKPNDKNLASLRGHLLWDDAARELRIERDVRLSLKESVTKIPYSEVAAVQFDTITNPLRRDVLHGAGSSKPANAKVEDEYLHLTLVSGDSHLVEIDDEDVLGVIAKARDLFGSKVSETPVRRGDKASARDLPERSSHFSLKIVKKPLPQPLPGKALVWVLSPKVQENAWHNWYGKPGPPQMRLHANNKIVAVTRQGTYSYAQLDPGDYELISQTGDHANGFRRTLEAGREYFFYQNEAPLFSVVLSEQSRDVALHELTGLQFGEWKRR